ncbi:AfsR/SARP family transcriptional regulator [Kineosporia corallincola]|nr:BTAD domain-containing putative transcriptional regulator [Kineosporia corallincola]
MYLLDLPPEAIDSRRFEEASESGRSRLAAGDPVGAAHELRSALQLWRGAGLPDLTGVPGAAASVARLQSLRLSTLADRIDAESLLGRHSRLIPELQDLVRRHPLHERFIGQLMTSLYWEGRQAEALAVYATAADRLGDELGIDPGPVLRDLHGRLLRQELGPIGSVPWRETDSESTVSAGSGPGPVARLARASLLSQGSDSALLETEFGSKGGPGGAPGRIPGQRSGTVPIHRGGGPSFAEGSWSAAQVGPVSEGFGQAAVFRRARREIPGAVGAGLLSGADRGTPDGSGPRGAGESALAVAPPHPRSAPEAFRPGVPNGLPPEPPGRQHDGPGTSWGVPAVPGCSVHGDDMPDLGLVPSIGTKRTAFGAAFGTGTVGRGGELETALELLRDPDVRLVTFVGPGGAGKTRLAAQVVARRMAERGRHPDSGQAGTGSAPRVLVIPLSGTDGGTTLAARLRRVLGVAPDTPAEPPLLTVCRALAATPCLLVLDDLDADAHADASSGSGRAGADGLGGMRQSCENAGGTDELAGAVATVTELLTRVGGLRVLATSRRPLGVAGERVIGLGPLHLPWAWSGAADVETVRAAEAVRLFRERARAVLPAFEVTGQNAGPVSGLCRTLDGLPLALELAAARTRSRTPDGIADDLAAQAAAAQANPGGVPGAMSGVAPGAMPGAVLGAVLDWTTGLLDETERLVLSQLSVFVGGATLDAAERVCGPVPGPGQVIDVIGRLADKNLLLIDETGRLGMLSPVREHARRLLAADPEAEAACADRHAAYFAETADALPPMTDRWFDPAGNPAGAASAGRPSGSHHRAIEFDNLHAAAAHAETRDGEVFSRLTVALLDHGPGTGRWELGDAPAWLARAQVARPTARTGARLLLAAGGLALFGGSPARAAEILGRVPAGATTGEAGAVTAIRVALMRAVVARTQGHAQRALTELEPAVEGLRGVRGLPDVLWHAVVNAHADVLDDLGRTAQAIGYWQRSRHRAAAGGDPARLASPLAMLALAAQDRGEERLARVLIGQACAAAGGGGPAIRAGVAVAEGVIELRHGDPYRAVDPLRSALRETHRGGLFFMLPRIVALLGAAHRPHDPERAAALLAASSAWCAQRGIVIGGHRERGLIERAETGLTGVHPNTGADTGVNPIADVGAGRPGDAVRRAAARGAAVPFGSLAGVCRLDPAQAPGPKLIDLTGDVPRILS